MGTISSDVTNRNMKIKGITDEDFVNFKVPSMFIAVSTCTFKCDLECGRRICQNSALAHMPDINVDERDIVNRYLKNKITHAIVFGGLEPMDQSECVAMLSAMLCSEHCDDPIVIYTGYTKEELLSDKFRSKSMDILSRCGNVIMKYGRFVPDQEPHFDFVLGVNLASDNQYAERL